jgi:hypothetical protein
MKLLHIEQPAVWVLSNFFAIPWPAWTDGFLISRAGRGTHVAGAYVATAGFNWPYVGERGWYVELSQGSGWRSPWSRRSTAILLISTAPSLAVWGLRFGGLLGGSPF